MARPASRPNVLVVDDDPAVRLLCCVNLEAAGLAVREAADGRQALVRARRKRPDLVLTDVTMPRLDGFQLAEALRADERTREIPLIFLSAESAPENHARARALGALAYLTKPFDPSALASIVADALARSGIGAPAPALGGVNPAA
jgi:two-component system chemotaxis response regulator CheY